MNDKEKVVFMGKVIGHIEGRTFITPRTPQLFFRKYNGFGISKKVLGYLNFKGVDKVSIVYAETPIKFKTFNIDLKLFFESPLSFTDESAGREDEQKIVSIPGELLI